MKILIIGTYIPRKCGIATFTHDLFNSISDYSNEVDVIAISDGTEYSFPSEVKRVIQRDNKLDYIEAGKWANQQNYSICIVQHEFGIFGGEAGDFILDFILSINFPVISNLHTILQHPNPQEFKVIQKVCSLSDRITVMTNRGVKMMQSVYQINPNHISLIPHGVPNFTLTKEEAKSLLGLEDKKVMLSFGLLGRNKGYEIAIEATSKVIPDDFVYIILGATHPNVLKEEGDSYKNSLIDLAGKLKLSGKVFFINHFVSDELLQQYLKACDIYVTPYPNENQMSSGTLSFALGAGAAVISTPYWYAKDLLANNRGILFDFNDVNGLASNINQLLSDPESMKNYQLRAEDFGKTMSWMNVGKMHLRLISSLINSKKKIQVIHNQDKTLKFLAPGKTKNLLSS